MMNNINTTGYTAGTETESNNYNVIPGNLITMQNVNKQLTLIPIVNGKPQYDKRRIANPGDPDIDFGEGVTAVMEIPYAQAQYGMIGGNNPYSNMGMGSNVNFNNPTPPIDASLQGFNYNGATPNMNLNLPSTAQPANFIPQPSPPKANLELSDERINQWNSQVNAFELGEDMKVSTDPNLRQQMEAQIIYNKRATGKPFTGAINPYGGWNLANSSVMLGASIESGNTLGIIGSAGKILSEGARNAFSGYSAMKRYNESQQDYLENDAEARQRQDEYWASSHQKGGTVDSKKRSGLLLTGNFLDGNEEHPMPNAEVESGEYLQTPDGNTMEIVGKRHSEGGELVSVPEGTKVISDYLKIGGILATYFKKNYNLNVSAGSTFATVLDRYKKKIGLTKLLEDEAKLMEKIVDQEEVELESTRDINLQVLSKRVSDLQPEKEPLEKDFNEFTNLIFEKQEESKPEEEKDFEKQEGGQVDPQQAQMMTAIQQYAEMNGQDPQELMSQIESMPPEQQEQILAEIMGGAQGQQQAGSSNIEQLIQTYAQIVGQDPNAIIEQMQNMSDEEVQQFIQEMTNTIESQGGGKTAITTVPDESTEGQQEFKNGGSVKKYQPGGLRTKTLSEVYDTMPFTAVNIEGYTDFDLQHLNPTTGVYDNFDPNQRIGRYLKDVPVGAENYFEQRPDGNYGLKQGVQYKDFQKGYNDLMGRTRKFFETQTDGMSDTQKKSYLDNLKKYNSDIIFTTDKESEYKGKTARGIDNKFGQFTSTRSGYQRNIVTPEQRKQLEAIGVYKLSQLVNNDDAKKIVGDELYNKLEKENKDFGGIDYRILDKAIPAVQTPENSASVEAGADINPYVDKTPENSASVEAGADINPYVDKTPENSASVEAGADINPYVDKTQQSVDLPMMTPDQSNLPPKYLATSMRQMGSTQADRVFLSPEENLKELARQSSTASSTLVNNNPYTAGAGLANLQAQQNNATNQAISQTMMANQQDQRNVSNINEERIMNRDKTNIGLADKYEREQIVGLDNYYSEWRNFIDNRNKQNVVNWNLQNQQNMFNAINPNYKIGVRGQLQQTDEPFWINRWRSMGLMDPKTKQVIQKTTTPDGRTTTVTKTGDNPRQPRKGQKGGLMVTGSLLDLLNN